MPAQHFLPEKAAGLIEDIDKIHALGYNGRRKRQKIEDERFLYWCDVKEMLVWSEAPAACRYSDGGGKTVCIQNGRQESDIGSAL